MRKEEKRAERNFQVHVVITDRLMLQAMSLSLPAHLLHSVFPSRMTGRQVAFPLIPKGKDNESNFSLIFSDEKRQESEKMRGSRG